MTWAVRPYSLTYMDEARETAYKRWEYLPEVQRRSRYRVQICPLSSIVISHAKVHSIGVELYVGKFDSGQKGVNWFTLLMPLPSYSTLLCVDVWWSAEYTGLHPTARIMFFMKANLTVDVTTVWCIAKVVNTSASSTSSKNLCLNGTSCHLQISNRLKFLLNLASCSCPFHVRKMCPTWQCMSRNPTRPMFTRLKIQLNETSTLGKS